MNENVKYKFNDVIFVKEMHCSVYEKLLLLAFKYLFLLANWNCFNELYAEFFSTAHSFAIVEFE